MPPASERHRLDGGGKLEPRSWPIAPEGKSGLKDAFVDKRPLFLARQAWLLISQQLSGNLAPAIDTDAGAR
jgi:hypothetical protein